MKVTVAICTWNRAALLDQTLERMKCLRIPEGVTWELLVVNNNCTDNTDEVIAKHCNGSLPLRRLFESKQGHSNARNCAVKNAQGELIIWTDDDVLVQVDWLSEFVLANASFPAATFFGGTVHPWFETSPPRWLVRYWSSLRDFYAIRELGPDIRPLAPQEEIFGANMMFRTEVLRRYPFDPARGHNKTAAIGGDETDVIRRMRLDGHHGVWVGKAVVEHFIPRTRMTKQFLRDYLRRMPGPPPELMPIGTPTWQHAPRWLWRMYFVSRLRETWASLTHDSTWPDLFIRSASLRRRLDQFRTPSPPDEVLVGGDPTIALTGRDA